MPKHPKKISEEIIHQNPWWVYKRAVFELPNGEKGDYYYGENIGNVGGVVIIPILDDGRLILINEFRHLVERESVGFPTGAIDPGEQPMTTAERELLEETGYQSTEHIKAGSFEDSIGRLRAPIHVFIANELTRVSIPTTTDAMEQIEVIYRRVDEFEDMIRRGEIIDGNTLGAWALAREHVHKFLANRVSK